MNDSRLEQVLQSAQEIQTASEASITACGFVDEDERLEFIRKHADSIIEIMYDILGYGVSK